MWIRNYINEIEEYLTESGASAQELEAFEEYTVTLKDREELLDRYPGQTIFRAPQVDKELLNDYSARIIHYEVEVMGSPIYEDLKKKYESQDSWPEFMRDNKGRFTETLKTANAGWYQNSKGELFHYDGTIWDNVPEERLQTLEYLG